MKKRLIPGSALLLSLSLVLLVVSGCSSISLKWFSKPHATQVQTVTNQKAETKSPEQLVRSVQQMTDQMVEKVNAGKWGEAITVGEAAYAEIQDNELTIKKDKTFSHNFVSVKERLLETLSEAYNFKNSIDGLDTKEIDNYQRTAREHFNINPADPFKKLAYSEVLLKTGDIQQGLKLATELNNSQTKDKNILENYAWALYLSGRKDEAYKIYKDFYIKSETLNQLYHSAVVIEEYDKLLGLILYKGCEKAGNNLMVLEANTNNLSAQSAINNVINKSQKAYNRLLVGGFRIDSKYNMNSIDNIVKSIVKLSRE